MFVHFYCFYNKIKFDRKRQSVIVRTPDNKIILYTKGADSIIEKRLKKTVDNNELKIKTWNHLEEYASEGLRTLLLAKREISLKEYEQWADSYLVLFIFTKKKSLYILF